MPYLLIIIIALALIGYFIFKPSKKPAQEEYFISTRGQSEERISSLGLDKASDNAAHILDNTKLSFPTKMEATEDVEYKPNAEKDWIIDVTSTNPITYSTEQLFKIFDQNWRVNYGAATVYGFSNKEKKWTYAIIGGDPDTYSKIQVAIDLVEVNEDDNSTYDVKQLADYMAALKKKLQHLPIHLTYNETMEQAAQRAQQLAAFKAEFDIEAIIVLKSDHRFNGKLAWDALQSVGLAWGDGDLFHWNNEQPYGHDQHFSVWTSTEPGYFLPERIKDGSMHPTDLGFGFSIPRSADPANVFAVMLEAVQYCQKRLGGTILDKNGYPLNEATEKKQLDILIQKMKQQGLVPGSDKALTMF